VRLRKIEDALERALEGAFDRVLPGRLQPAEIYRVLWRAMDDHRTVSADRTYVPNRFTVRLNPGDLKELAGVAREIEGELAQKLAADASADGLVFGARILVHLEPDEGVRPGRVEVEARTSHEPLAAQLVAETGVLEGQTFSLRSGMVLGRSTDCDIRVPEAAVSRHHCRFDWEFEGFRLTDLGSRNGTWVNGVQVTQYILQHNDLIAVGDTRLRFRYQC
jgi:hypothetical protein